MHETLIKIKGEFEDVLKTLLVYSDSFKCLINFPSKIFNQLYEPVSLVLKRSD